MADLTTVGVELGYAAGAADTKPTAFEQLFRIKKIGGVSLEPDKIETTALEDFIKQYEAGAYDTGGSWPITMGLNNDTVAAWADVLTAYDTAAAAGNVIWWEVYFPKLTKAFFIQAIPGLLPMPDIDLSSASDVQINCTIQNYIGVDTAVQPTTA